LAENATDLRLATILALDVVGFSALMNSDELGTLRKVQTLQREIIFPQVERNGGTIFKLIGDGVLAHFPSVDGAFTCGKEILGELARSALDLRVRIGIHSDYVFFEDGDVFGDGVNVAARLEGSAFPGTIALSERALKGLSEAEQPFKDLGKLSLKNIRDPVRVLIYRPGYSRAAARFDKFLIRARRPAIIIVGAALLVGAAQAIWYRLYGSPERVGEAALSGLACSWLGIQRVTYANGVPFLEIEGAALQDRTTLANKIRADIARDAQSEVRIDVRRVSALPSGLCEFVERFKELRYAGPPRLEIADVQRVNYFSIDLIGKNPSRDLKQTGQGLRLKMKTYPETFRSFAEMFAIHKDGSISELARLSQLNVVRQQDGSASFSLSTDRSVNAILLIDSASSIPASVVSDGNLDVTSFRKLEAAAGNGDWNAELHWFDPDSSSPAPLET